MARFEKPSDPRLRDTIAVEAEDQYPNESTASVEDSRDIVLEHGPRSPQLARDYSQRPLRPFITPAEEYDRSRDPSLIELSPINDSSRHAAYERNGPTTMRDDSIRPSPKDSSAFMLPIDYPFQPHVIPTTAASICDPLAEAFSRVAFKNVGLDPWNLSLTAPDSHGGMLFPRAGATPPCDQTSGIDGAGCSAYLPGPQGLLSHDPYVRSSRDGAEVPPIGRGEVVGIQNITWRRLPQPSTS